MFLQPISKKTVILDTSQLLEAGNSYSLDPLSSPLQSNSTLWEMGQGREGLSQPFSASAEAGKLLWALWYGPSKLLRVRKRL